MRPIGGPAPAGKAALMSNPLEGQLLGHYRVERMLGRGGMGAVFEGRDERTNQRIAIKVMTAGIMSDAESVARFEREASVAAQIQHSNVARVLDSGTEGEIRYLVMEFVDGRSLADLLRERGHIPGPRALDYIRQAASGLDAAHSRGAIHRDIKPENLMVTSDGTLKVVDFGLAKLQNADSFKTATGAVMGTPHYMSPEQATGRDADHRSDIYSLGATFFHLLAGRPPYEGENVFAILEKHVRGDLPSITRWNSKVPDGVCQIVYRMLAKHPDDRFQTYGHLIQVLDDAIQGRTGHSMTMEVIDDRRDAASAPPPGDRKRLLIAALTLFLFIAAAAGLYLRRDPAADAATKSKEAAKAGESNMPSAQQWKSQVFPILHDINKEIREQDEDVSNFETRRQRTQPKK